MKISKLKFLNHPTLKNLELDFTDTAGGVYDTVIFAGENGNGKTTILNSISQISSDLHGKYMEVIVRLDIEDILFVLENASEEILVNDGFKDKTPEEILSQLSHITISEPGRRNMGYWGMARYSFEENEKNILYAPYGETRSSIGFLLSNVVAKIKKNDKEPSFREVSQTTTLTIDNPDDYKQNNRIVSSNDLNISELLTNINYQDASELQNKLLETGTVAVEDAENRVKRFRSAFNHFFDNGLEFSKIDNFEIIFKKNREKFKVQGLSSGEKNIVQNGAFFLKDINLDNPFISILDEPEQSLNPLWEDRILEYYKRLLNKNGRQIAQLFVATHSEYVIKDAYEAKDLIFIMKRNASGDIVAEKAENLNLFPYSPTYNEIKYGAFNLPTSDFHNDLFGFLQERLNQITGVSTNIDDVDNFIDGQTGNYAVPTGWINGRGDRTLPVYIRNCIHHPESTIEPNPIRQKPNAEDIKRSIEILICIIESI
ncbi:AAA family ATPase [Candidatus Saccharibacteria bacterium]|nr:AAA family ATPase [Candidatus Saccharibacteria bacterium]